MNISLIPDEILIKELERRLGKIILVDKNGMGYGNHEINQRTPNHSHKIRTNKHHINPYNHHMYLQGLYLGKD